mgnify:CR=1 FL=1
MDRLVIVPDDEMEAVSLKLRSQLPALARALCAENLSDVIDHAVARILHRGVERTGFDELIVWGKSGRRFLVAWSSLAPEDEVVGIASADGMEGLVARVFRSERSESPPGGELDMDEWSSFPGLRGRLVVSMTASPLVLFDTAVGVLSLSRYQSAGLDASVTGPDLSDVAELALLTSRLIEDQLIRAAIGLKQ